MTSQRSDRSRRIGVAVGPILGIAAVAMIGTQGLERGAALATIGSFVVALPALYIAHRAIAPRRRASATTPPTRAGTGVADDGAGSADRSPVTQIGSAGGHQINAAGGSSVTINSPQQR